eukprot:15536791-Heterocapsa_arctica.AAC.1
MPKKSTKDTPLEGKNKYLTRYRDESSRKSKTLRLNECKKATEPDSTQVFRLVERMIGRLRRN